MRVRLVVAVIMAAMIAGSGVLAQGQGQVVHEFYTDAWSGSIGQCDDGAFDIWNEYETSVHQITRYNQGGQVEQIMWVSKFTSDVFYNSTDPSKQLTGSPGETQLFWDDFEDGVLVGGATAGLIVRVNVPGYGPVFSETGAAKFVDGFDWVFNAGFNQYWDGDIAALCGFLR